MPELPDVEAFRGYLDATALHHAVTGVHVRDERILEGTTPAALGRALHGRALTGTRRHGKHLLALVEEDGALVLHFGMTGGLRYEREPQLGRSDVMVVDFDNGYHLVIESQRRLGRVGLTRDPEGFAGARDLGPDALSLSEEAFLGCLGSGRATVKSALMDQGRLAGIGNVYSDEILFDAGIHPRRRLSGLGDDERRRLYGSLRRVLEQAADCGADPDCFPDDWLTPAREARPCPRCGGTIEKLTVSGRTAYACPGHQQPRSD
jgi:formamidopyrimidine-DNA glycosylase